VKRNSCGLRSNANRSRRHPRVVRAERTTLGYDPPMAREPCRGSTRAPGSDSPARATLTGLVGIFSQLPRVARTTAHRGGARRATLG
jgi:hypothetical protein